MFGKSKKLKQGEVRPGVMWNGSLPTDNENSYKTVGFKPNDAGVNEYGGVPSNDNPYEFGAADTKEVTKKVKLGSA